MPAALAFVAAAVALAACGGGRPENTGTPDAGDSYGSTCSFDSDCVPPGPPTAICSSGGICVKGCAETGCAAGLTCKASTGHCVASGINDGGVNDGGVNDGGVNDGGVSDGGASSATLCGNCSTNSDCQNSGLCISDPTHTYTYCTQDCTSTSCPSGFLCTTDSTNTHHQCIPSGGSCPNHGAGDGGVGTGDGGVTTGNGGPLDPTNPSQNGNGVDQCNGCNENNDCIVNAICLNSTDTGANDGYCAQQCNPANQFTIPLINIQVFTDCVSSECLNDLSMLKFSAAAVDCAINYSLCGAVDGTSQTFCSAALGTCGPNSGF